MCESSGEIRRDVLAMDLIIVALQAIERACLVAKRIVRPKENASGEESHV